MTFIVPDKKLHVGLIEIVRIPFQGRELPAYLHLPHAPGPGEAFPCCINIPGMDSSKETGVMMHGDGYLERGMAVCWQQSLNSIRHYMDWIAACRMIITCDSLGLHLALAMKKKVVALFGPTVPEQIYMYGQGVKLTPACERSCLGCMGPRCDFEQSCMEFITPEMVLDTVEILMPGRRAAETEKAGREYAALVGVAT